MLPLKAAETPVSCQRPEVPSVLRYTGLPQSRVGGVRVLVEVIVGVERNRSLVRL